MGGAAKRSAGVALRALACAVLVLGLAAGAGAQGIPAVVTVGNAGMELKDGARAIGNAVYGGLLSIGFFLTADETRSYSGVIQRNNIVGHTCGVSNHAVPALDATNNYWGAATGPGADPADEVCDPVGDGTTIVAPFATKPFSVKVLLDGPSPEGGATILAGGKPVGSIGSTANGKGIALVRIDRVADALDAGLPLTAGGLELHLAEPDVVRTSAKQPVA